MSQSIILGAGCIRELPAILSTRGLRRVFFVHGRSSLVNSSSYKILDQPTFKVEHFSDVLPNPDLRTVERGAAAFRAFGPEVMVAIGGGSVIDTAKAIIALAAINDTEDIIAGRLDGLSVLPYFIAAPTTAGSGSEATHFAVLYRNGIKYSIDHPLLKPSLAILDPELTLSCPSGLTLASGADAVCQAIESHWNRYSTKSSQQDAIKALSFLLPNLLTAFDRPFDISVRTDLLQGAHAAGRAIDTTKTTAGHALSYGLTTRYGIPHGLAVLLTMGPLVELMDQRYDFFKARSDLDSIFSGFGPCFPRAFAEFRRKLLEHLDSRLPSTTTVEMGEGLAAAVAALVEGVNVERLSNHPLQLEKDDISWIYEAILDEIKVITRYF